MVRFANKALVSDLYSGKNVLIFGLGRFGGQIAAARYFAERGARVTATDLKPAAELEGALADLEGLDVRFVLGHHETRDAELADLCCVSPAVPQRAPLLEVLRGRGVPLVTEVGLFLAQMSARPVCVTGSNGKTTTVSMLGAAMATDTSRANFVGGNVGRSLLPAVSQIRPSDHVLLELSSFQLDQLSWGAALRPRLALVTNLSPNHLDRHGSMESYLAAKRSLIEAVPAGGTVVLNRDDTASFSAFRRSVKGSLVTFGESADFTGPGTFVRDGQLLWRDAMGLEQRLIEAARIALPGAHNRANALAACAAAMVLGLGPAAFEAIAGFAGLPHRMEHLGGRLVAGRRKVSFVNDSKATTTEATLSALTAYPKVVYLGGGADKGVGFERLGQAIAAHADAAVLFGAAREAMAEAVRAAGSARPLAVEETLDQAFERALELAGHQGTVLLSPACASYDQFTSYVERGDRFRELVRGLPRAAKRGGRRAPRLDADVRSPLQ